MIFTPQQYLEAPPIDSSYKSKSGISFEDLGGECKKCNKPTKDFRGYIVEHPNCIEIRFAGVCHPCKLITSYHFRIYDDGRIMANEDDGWHEINTKSNWYSIIMDKFK